MRDVAVYLNNIAKLENILYARINSFGNDIIYYKLYPYYNESDQAYLRLTNSKGHLYELGTSFPKEFVDFVYKILQNTWSKQFDSKIKYLKLHAYNLMIDTYCHLIKFNSEESAETYLQNIYYKILYGNFYKNIDIFNKSYEDFKSYIV